MRLLALSVLLLGNLFAHQVLAEEVLPQPLTRADCGKSGMCWDDNANVCRVVFSAPEPQGAQPVEMAAQPLTRADCDRSGMAWDDNANVCVGVSLSGPAVPATP